MCSSWQGRLTLSRHHLAHKLVEVYWSVRLMTRGPPHCPCAPQRQQDSGLSAEHAFLVLLVPVLVLAADIGFIYLNDAHTTGWRILHWARYAARNCGGTMYQTVHVQAKPIDASELGARLAFLHWPSAIKWNDAKPFEASLLGVLRKSVACDARRSVCSVATHDRQGTFPFRNAIVLERSKAFSEPQRGRFDLPSRQPAMLCDRSRRIARHLRNGEMRPPTGRNGHWCSVCASGIIGHLGRTPSGCYIVGLLLAVENRIRQVRHNRPCTFCSSFVLIGHGQAPSRFCLPNLRRRGAQMVGKVRILRWLEHHHGRRRCPAPRVGRGPAGQGPQISPGGFEVGRRAAAPAHHRHRRV